MKLVCGMLLCTLTLTARAEGPLVFVSAFAAGEKGAISAYQADVESGALKLVERTGGVENPFFLACLPIESSCTRSTPSRSAARSTSRSPPMRSSAARAS